jgi:hypothetical protein
MCKSKREKTFVTAIETTAQVGEPSKPLNYPCHIYGIVDHKLMNCSKFGEMQTVFKNKGDKIVKKKHIIFR